MIKLPETNVTAEITFNDSQQAAEFAKAYTRKTLMGHIVGGSTVKVYNVTDEHKQFIDSWISKINNL